MTHPRSIHRLLTRARRVAYQHGVSSDARLAEILDQRQGSQHWWARHFGFPRVPRRDILRAALAELRGSL